MDKDKFLQEAFNELLRIGFEFIEPNEYKLTREATGAVYMLTECSMNPLKSNKFVP